MSLTIDASERNLLYDCLCEHLTGLDAISQALENGDARRAEDLSRTFVEELQFALDDLGFGNAAEAEFKLTSPPDRLARVLRGVQQRAEEADRAEAPELEAAQRQHEQNRLVMATCQRLLAELGPC